jgi:NOL1/NOP2/fmu family ribosome biogenesis protein
MPEVVIGLDEQDFRKLVAGRVVEVEAVSQGKRFWIQIGLKDIGWDSMVQALRDAGDENGKGDPAKP